MPPLFLGDKMASYDKCEESVVLDEFHAHEALDRMNLICSMIDDFILEHPWIKAHSKIQAKIGIAQKILGEVACSDIATVIDAEDKK